MQRVGEGVCWGASGQGLQLGYEADSQGSCRMGQRLRISTGIIKRKKEQGWEGGGKERRWREQGEG